MPIATPEQVYQFWFDELSPKNWFEKSGELDQTISLRFKDTLISASKGELFHWRKTPKGRLAEIIVLDQFSRNIFRDSPQAFSQDSMALTLSQEAVLHKIDDELESTQKSFLYMPYMHSESLIVHEVATQLFNQPGLEHNYEFELKHKVIVQRFGRYPHRNKILNRPSTKEELEFLKQPGSGF